MTVGAGGSGRQGQPMGFPLQNGGHPVPAPLLHPWLSEESTGACSPKPPHPTSRPQRRVRSPPWTQMHGSPLRPSAM